jgi:hypothetical protein
VEEQGVNDAGDGGAGPAERRLGRAVLFVLQQAQQITNPVIRADVGALLLTGQAMDLAVRIKGYRRIDGAPLVIDFAKLAGISERQLYKDILPVLQQADVVDYDLDDDGRLRGIEEFVGVTGTVIAQTFRVLDRFDPSGDEVALLHSVEIAAWAPLTVSQHLEQVKARTGAPDETTERALQYARAIGVNQSVASSALGEPVVFNPHVWGTGQVEIASFLRNLPPNERDALLGICEAVAARPGTRLDSLSGDERIVTGARKVGLIQAAQVKSSAHGQPHSQTYAFSPLIQTDDDQATTTEALHLRKLFLAHVLFGQERARSGYGRISDPVRLVESLLNRGRVGPATNIGTDYHLLEAAGVVQVEGLPGERAFLKLLKEDIVRDGLDWLKASLGHVPGGSSELTRLASVPTGFVTPEADRFSIHDDAATNEILTSTILHLREEAQRAVRYQSPFSG